MLALLALVTLFMTACGGSSGTHVTPNTQSIRGRRTADVPAGPSVAIHAGGAAVGYFAADKYWVGYSGTNTDASPIDVSADNAAPAALYSTYRTAPKTLTYAVTGLPANAPYHGFLHFQEPLLAGAGLRVLNVTAGGVAVVTGLDIYSAAGNKQHKAVVVPLSATADSTGTITIVISSTANSPIISGFELYPDIVTPAPMAATAPPTPAAPVVAINAGGPGAGYFGPDKFWVGYSGKGTDKSAIDTSAPNAAPAGLYATYRTAPKTLTYAVTGLTAGASYYGYLHFQEPLIGAAGVRVLDVSVGGKTVATALDIYSAAGNKQHKAVVIPMSASADANGTLSIVITSESNSPIISGFEIYATGGGPTPTPAPTASPTPAPTPTPALNRPNFLGAFFRAVGTVPYGVLAAGVPQVAPSPYPTPGTNLFGSNGYCDRVAANGVSISSGYVVDWAKLTNIVNLGVGWTRTDVSSDLTDQTHTFIPGFYTWSNFDAAQCAELRNGITPVVNIEAGVVQYDAIPGVYSPKQYSNYKTAADFGTWCGAIAQHEVATFGAVNKYSIPGNEVNISTAAFPGGNAQVASYTQACYSAIKAAQPNAFVYGFELDMDTHVNAPAWVQAMYDLGCRVGTCYDGLSIHMFMPYPLPASGTPCLPAGGGNYDIACVTAVQTAAHAPTMHVLIGETAYMVTSTVPDETTKATAVVAAMKYLAANPYVDGVNYANVDECALYPSGYFAGGCLVDTSGNKLPAYGALAALANSSF